MKPLLLACLLLLSACVTTPGYLDHSGSSGAGKEERQEPRATDIHFRLSSQFYHDPPLCAIVLPTDEAPDAGSSLHIARAFARHLRGRMDRVIFPREAMGFAQNLALDLDDKRDLRRLAHKSRCTYFARTSVYDYGEDFGLILAQKKIGVHAALYKPDIEDPVWEATNTAWRGDGGVPVSPLSIITSVTSAAIFNQNREIMASLTDDLFRRLVTTLPDNRSF